MATFRMTLLMKQWTNIVMDDAWVHTSAKTLPSLVSNLWWNMKGGGAVLCFTYAKPYLLVKGIISKSFGFQRWSLLWQSCEQGDVVGLATFESIGLEKYYWSIHIANITLFRSITVFVGLTLFHRIFLHFPHLDYMWKIYIRKFFRIILIPHNIVIDLNSAINQLKKVIEILIIEL